MKTFSIKESIKFGWETVKANFWFVIGTTLVYSIFNMGVNVGNRSKEGGTEVVPEITSGLILAVIGVILLGIIFVFISIIVQIGYTRIYLKLHDEGERPKFKELFTNVHPFWRYVSVSILYGLIILGGLILLIVPGVIWGIKYSFAPILVIDKGMKPMEAIRESAKITFGHKMHLFKFCLLIGVLNIAGFLALGVGVLISIPVTTLAYIYAYRRLSGTEPVTVAASASPAPAILENGSENEPTITA